MSSALAIVVACVVAVAIAQPLPSSSVAPAQFSCEGLSVGQHAAAMNACESYFYQCPEGYTHGIRLNCTELTFFDEISKQCLYAADVVACGGVATTTEAASTTTTEATTTTTQPTTTTTSAATTTTPMPTTTPHVTTTTTHQPTTTIPADQAEKFSCVNKMDGIYASESDKCSSVFWTCSNGATHMHTCPGELKFDIMSKTCLESDFISSCGGQATTSIPTSNPVKDAPQGTCDGKMGGNFDLKNGTCAHEYVACTNDGRGWIFTCPSDLYFDVEFNRCEYKDFIPICEGSRPDVATTTTTIAATTVAPVVRRR